MNVLESAEAILAVDDLKTEPVHIPEWGGSVLIRLMSAKERGKWEQEWAEKKDKGGAHYDLFREHLVVHCAVNSKGERLFTDEQMTALAGKCAPALDRLYIRCVKLNKLGKDDLDFFVGDSAKTPGGDSSSA